MAATIVSPAPTAQAAASLPEVAAAFTRTQFLTGTLPDSPLARKAANSFNSPAQRRRFLGAHAFCGSLLQRDRHHAWKSLELRRPGAADLVGKRIQARVLRHEVRAHRFGGHPRGPAGTHPAVGIRGNTADHILKIACEAPRSRLFTLCFWARFLGEKSALVLRAQPPNPDPSLVKDDGDHDDDRRLALPG
jgi:hypothetical protein